MQCSACGSQDEAGRKFCDEWRAVFERLGAAPWPERAAAVAVEAAVVA